MNTKKFQIKMQNVKVSASGLLLTALSSAAMAQGKGKLNLPILDEFGCSLLEFMTGPLAIWAFVLICAGTLVIGLLMKMDFAKLLSAVVIIALLQGLGAWVAPMLTNPASCIANNGG